MPWLGPDHPWSTGISAASRSWAKRLWQRRQIRPRLDLALEHWQKPGGSMLILEEIWRHIAAFFAEHACYFRSVLIAYLKMDWFSWEIYRKPSIFPWNMGLSCKNSRENQSNEYHQIITWCFLNPLYKAATAATLWTLWAFHMVVESWGIDISVATRAIDK